MFSLLTVILTLFLTVTDVSSQALSRYYIGGAYEYYQTPDGSRERLYLGGDAYSAPMVYQRDNGGNWTAYNIGRGFTGHEVLPWFGLVNMNARLYDPLLGRFLSPDPYIQSPDFTQNFNRYSYCLNNPLKYTDESGEWVHILIGAIIGGISNLVANWNNCDGFWEYFTSFGVGAGTGAAVAATGGALAAAGGGFLGTIGVVGAGALGGAINGATSDIISQTGVNFEGLTNIDWSNTWKSAAVGGFAGAAGTGIGLVMAGVHIPIKINGKIIESPIVSSFVTGAAAGAVGHVAGGTAMGLFEGKSFKESFYNSLNGVWKSALIGGAFSAASTAAVSLVNGINPLNGKEILIRAKYLGITEQEIQHVKNVRNGEPGKFFHDGKEYYNKDGILPENTTYTEYVISRPGGLTPAGTHRIIVGADGSWYYTPDHHTTFFKFKP